MRPAALMLVLLPHARSMLRRPLCCSASGGAIGGAALRSSRGLAVRAAAAAEPAEQRRFLIENKHNDVERIACADPVELGRGLLETEGLPHICIAGESNAGKSSLINHLLHKKGLARASSVAGKTRSVDLMRVNDRVVIADLPGLPSRDGQVTQVYENYWGPLIYDYMRRCDTLLAMVYVHDIRWRVSPLVRRFLEDVQKQGLPVLLALTKDDKIVSTLSRVGGPPARDAEHEARQRMMRRARRSLGFDGVHLHYSTNSDLPVARKARRRLLRYIESLVDAGDREACARLLESIADEKRETGGEMS